MGGGAETPVVQPHDHQHVLGVLKNSTQADARAAIAGRAATPRRAGARCPFDDRAAILLKAADLLAGPWRQRINAATMLGQSKTAFQAEIDSACELIDFWRFNVHFAQRILADQPIANSRGIWNRTDHRPLEGFVYAITPFNFTAIAGNLPTAPALMGNTVIWKPSPTQQVAAHLTMELLEEAGMPPGVINMLPGDGLDVSQVALGPPRPRRHPLHRLHADLPAPVGRRSARTSRSTAPTRASSARPAARTSSSRTRRPTPTCSGSRCSAARSSSRARSAPPRRGPTSSRSVWKKMKDAFVAEVESITMGDVTDFSNFMGAVIDDRAFAKHKKAIARAKRSKNLEILAGGAGRRLGRLLRPADRHREQRPDRPDVLRPSTSARSSPCTSSRTATSRRSSRRWSRSRRTP